MEHRPVLRKIFGRPGVKPEQLETIVRAFQPVSFKQGEFVLRGGRVADEYFFIREGWMRSYAIDPEGQEVTTGFYTQRNIVLEVASFFLRLPTQEHIIALTDCTCWRLSFDQFQTLFHSIEGFREAGRDRLVKGYVRSKQRSLAMITVSAKERYLELLEERPDLLSVARLKDVATFLGITDTSFSRLRREVAQEAQSSPRNKPS